ncbi:MAG: hypothetical protein HYX28_03080 [Candidatus Koribacter versatilis]|uniref:Uncharacterized protein n=1 Tax=Candidatus Korobacter versatilis TaxID=658062 RepID=A0A932ENX5_9BACT|nr:hypothetical protein [Candidatus Koribacter versatilis]
MRRVWLLATNVVREQRWFLLVMFAYITGITGMMLFAGDGREDDVLAVFKQVAAYGTFFSVVIAASLIQTDRKSRQIIAVLSKAVTRREYIAGMIGGVNLSTASYQAAVFASLFVLFRHAPIQTAVVMMLHLLVASLLVSVVTILFTTFLHPLLATGAAGMVLAAPIALEKMGWTWWARAMPAVALIKHALSFTLEQPLAVESGVLTLALAECVALWLLAGWIFERRDVTLAVE